MTGPRLSAQQIKAIDALLAHDDRDAAATAAGVSKRSLRRWLALEHFQAELARQRTRLLTETATILARGAAACSRSLVAMGSGGAPANAAQVTAAVRVVELAAKAAELDDLGRRLERLEDLVAAAHDGGDVCE